MIDGVRMTEVEICETPIAVLEDYGLGVRYINTLEGHVGLLLGDLLHRTGVELKAYGQINDESVAMLKGAVKRFLLERG